MEIWPIWRRQILIFLDAPRKVALDYALRADGAENELRGEPFGFLHIGRRFE